MFLGYQNNKIKFYTQEPLNQELYNLDKVEETDKEYVLEGDEYVLKTSEWEEEQLNKAKEAKYQEANTKTNDYLQSGEALYEFKPNIHIEATDGNIAKMNAYLTGLQAGAFTTVAWVSKEDEILTLNAEDVSTILLG